MDVKKKLSSEKRLIDANAMRDDWMENGENEYVYDTNAVLDSIDSQPTVDAVEVVRCKDCKYYCQDKINGVICRHPALDFDTECFDHWINTNPDDFCSYGELKEGVG